MDPNSGFQKKLFEYLESAYQGKFFNGSKDDVLTVMNEASQSEDYKDPNQTLPVPPPQPCDDHEVDSSSDMIPREKSVY